MDSNRFEQVLASLERHAARRKGRARNLLRVYGFSACVCLVLLGLIPALHRSPRLPLSVLSLLSVLLLLGAAAMAQRMNDACRPPTEEERGAAMALLHHNDVRAIGPLCEELAHLDFLTLRRVMNALTYLLPVLRAGNAHHLNADQRAHLHTAMRSAAEPTSGAFHVDFVLAALDALSRIGDAGSVGILKHLARERGKHPDEARIRAAACSCLALLETRLQRAKTTDSLLRAADDSSRLLRTNPDSNPLPESQLLRPRTRHE